MSLLISVIIIVLMCVGTTNLCPLNKWGGCEEGFDCTI